MGTGRYYHAGMELTAKLIEETEFRQTFRGYDVDQVDDFLERVAAGVEELRKQVQRAAKQPKAAGWAPPATAAPAGATAREPAPVQAAGPDAKALEDNTDELRRTLILAQRTADAAIREAREEATRLLTEAHDRSSHEVAEAQAKATRLVRDAEARAVEIVAEAERMAESHRSSSHERLTSEIASLEGTREELRTDATIIDRHVEEQRQQLRSAVGDLQRLIDDPKGFRLASPPAPRAIVPPVFEPPEPIGPAPTAQSIGAGAAPPDPSHDIDADDQPGVSAPGAEHQTSPKEPPASSEAAPAEAAEAAPADPPADESTAPSGQPGDGAEQAEAKPPAAKPPAAEASAAEASAVEAGEATAPPAEQWSSLRNGEMVDLTIPDPGDITDKPAASQQANENSRRANEEVPDSGEPTRAVPQLVGDADEDAFLAELRKAMTDDEPLGPRDNVSVPTRPTVDPLDDRARPRPRFGRRR